MRTITSVPPRGAAMPTGPRRARRALTAIRPTTARETYAAPVADPGGRTRREVWEASSVEQAPSRTTGDMVPVWEYRREDDGESSPWVITYVPTGQAVTVYGSLADARARTAGRLLDELRGQAYKAAFEGDGEARRVEGQRWLARHMHAARIGAGGDVDYRCRCGGLLVEVARGGRLGHVDACRECYTYGLGVTGEPCPHADDHRFCGTPDPVECGHQRDNGCVAPALPTDGAGCGRGDAVDCCAGCCWRE